MKKLSAENFDTLKEKIVALLKSIREMIFKEESIFIPLSMRVFTNEDWRLIYRDAAEFDCAFIDEAPKWASGEIFLNQNKNDAEGTVYCGAVNFETGELNFAQLKGILKLLPVGVTYHAVYDDTGEYIGAVEFVQDFSKAVDKFET